MKKAVVLGLGISGIAATELLLSYGYLVIGMDRDREKLCNDQEIQRLKGKGALIQLEQEAIDWKGVECLILSPGIAQTHPVCRKAASLGIEVVGEAELVFRQIRQKCVGITGTNGKTTVTLLVEHVLNSAGIRARALGNVGEPLARYLLEGELADVVVAEVSSYQLETMKSPVFDAAVIMNITPDHLDRYANMEEYARAKCQIQSCLKPEGSLYVHEEVMRSYSEMLAGANVQTFGSSKTANLWTDKNAIFCSEGIAALLPPEYRERGIHESKNALGAWSLCHKLGVSAEEFAEALKTFKKPPHRVEFVDSIEGVDFYDDSKGTNVDAVIQAALSMQGPVILIVGGVDKGASYLPWQERLQGKIKKILAIGQAAPKIQKELSPYFDIEMVDSLEGAVRGGAQCAVRGDCVLLSPGCSSYDMFRDYAHRGEEFQRHVQDLVQERR